MDRSPAFIHLQWFAEPEDAGDYTPGADVVDEGSSTTTGWTTGTNSGDSSSSGDSSTTTPAVAAPAVAAPAVAAPAAAATDIPVTPGGHTPQTNDELLATAGQVAGVAQGGAVNSAEGAGKAAGLSPTQAALLGAMAGSSTYQSSLGGAYNTASAANVGLTSSANAYDVGMQTTANQLEAAKMAAEADKKTAEAAGWGSFFSALSPLLLLLRHGSDSTEAGPTIVGENGPELVDMPKGAKVYPNIKDGYDMLNYVARQNKTSKNVNPPPQMDPTNVEVSNTAMIQALNDKLEKVSSYIKKGGR